MGAVHLADGEGEAGDGGYLREGWLDEIARPGGGTWGPQMRLAVFEYHAWGYFLEYQEKAVAVIGHGPRALHAALKELSR